MKGQPVVDAVVVFTPVGEHQESMKASQAVTDSEGQFVIRTHITGSQYKEGVAAGEYRVTVTKMEVIADMRRSPKNLLPRKYATLSSSELVAVVQAHGENSFEFELD